MSKVQVNNWANYAGTMSMTFDDAYAAAKPVASYAALRAYTGTATFMRVNSRGIEGVFYYDATDTTSADNKGTIIVATNGKRWKRYYVGAIRPEWFGLVEGADGSVALQAAVDAASSLAVQTNRRVEVMLSGEIRLSPQFYHSTTDWRHCILVKDNVIVSSDSAKIVTSIAFANRAVVFLCRGDNITIKDLHFYDETTASSSFAIGVGAGSTYDGSIGSNRTYTNLVVKGCRSDNLWQTSSVQFGALDDGTVFWDGVTYDRVLSYARQGVASAGNLNARSDPPHKVKNVEMLFCKAKYGVTASSFNLVGVDGGQVVGCRSDQNLFAACELENGCKNISVWGLKSKDDAIGLWIDDSMYIEANDVEMINTIPSIVSPLHGTLGLNRNIVKISKQGYTADPNAETGHIRVRGLKGKNFTIDVNSYSTPVGVPVFSNIEFDGFDIDNDGVTASSRAVFFSNVPDITLKNGRIRGAVTQQILGSSSGGYVVIDNVIGYIKGTETPAGMNISGTSSSVITNTRLQSFTAFPTGTRMEKNCFDANGVRPEITPGGQKHYYAVTGSPEGVLDGGPGSTVHRSDNGSSYTKTGTGTSGWKLVTVAA